MCIRPFDGGPALSTAHATGDRSRFLRLLGSNLTSIALITTLAAVALIVVGELAIRVLLGGGAFGPDDVARTAAVLGAFAFSVPFESVSHLLSRAIYATRHTLLQVVASLGGLGVTILATLALLPALEIIAIPIGYAIGQAVKVVLLGLALAIRMRSFDASSASGIPGGAGAEAAG